MMKKLINATFRLFLVILLLVSSIIYVPAEEVDAATETLGDLKDELAQMKKDRNESQGKENATEAEIKKSNADIAAAYQAIDDAKNAITVAENDIRKSNEEIDSASGYAAELMVLFEQISDQDKYLEYVTGANTMTDLIMRNDAIELLLEHNNDTIYNLEELIMQNEAKQLELIEEQDKLEKNIVSYESKIEDLEYDLSYFAEITEDIDDQIKNQEILIKYYEDSGCKDDENLSTCLNRIENTTWIKPLNSATVTSPWGMRYLWGSWSMHNGIDLGGNSQGTPVYAAAAGTVAAITRKSSCGGNKVYVYVIVGGKKYTTTYLHLLDINVSVGQTVYTTTQIGTVGGGSKTPWDNCSTGAHLHFGISEGYYLTDYTSYNTLVSKSIDPPGFPDKYGKFTSRTQWFN